MRIFSLHASTGVEVSFQVSFCEDGKLSKLKKPARAGTSFFIN